ncbi:uncharacterized protein A4U43_C09F5870 [Asparagus officinalis]|uniref:HIT domain-containing protein n=1 Tax=Asparagus officinalis TaxID=4686 RepID=A0A5P1E7E9_ASPOF|nr:uncharacterized protein A4U43_C09F5870 [Asparagus officinalis]
MQVVAAMCSKVPFLSNAIMKATQSDSFNLLVNNGLAAGQVIFHTHFHIIPRKTGDKLWPSEDESITKERSCGSKLLQRDKKANSTLLLFIENQSLYDGGFVKDFIF